MRAEAWGCIADGVAVVMATNCLRMCQHPLAHLLFRPHLALGRFGQDAEAALKQREERGERPATGSACLLPPPRHDLPAAGVEHLDPAPWIVESCPGL